MKYTLTPQLDKTTISTIIKNAREFEARRDIKGAINNFAPIWENIQNDPDFSGFETSDQGELYRLVGFFLSLYGSMRNLKNYQERAKDVIFKAVEIFDNLGDKFKLADAKNILALCYFAEGAILEGETVLEQTALSLKGDELVSVYIWNRINVIQSKIKQKKFQESLQIIEEIQIPMEFCDDYFARAVFHEKVAIIYRTLDQFDKAILNFNESIKFSYKLNNLPSVCVERNNLAFVYNKTRDFQLAHLNINEALQIAREINLTGWIPIYLDTQALIFANEGYPEIALEKIDEAISLYQNGDDYYGLTESIWNKCSFLLQLNRKEEAIKLFADLVPIAAQRMGEFAVDNFVKEFSNLIHVKQNGSLDDEVKRFKRNEIVNAIREANYNLFEASDSLKIKLNELTKILDKEFPELYEELNIEHFAKLNSQRSEKDYSAPRKISRLDLKEVEFTFETEIFDKFSTFYVSSEKIEEVFAISEDFVLAIVPTKEITTDEYILVHNQDKDLYSFGKVQYDQTLDLYFLVDKDEPMPLSLNEVDLIGKALAYFPFSEIDNSRIQLRDLKF